jgi:hypothetical protein
MATKREVVIGWEGDDGAPMRVRCSVTPGYAGRGPDMNGPGEPPEPPEVEVLSVHEDKPGGVERPDLVPVVEGAIDSIHDQAVEEASDQVESDEYEAGEREGDARRDEARLC